MTEAEIYLFLGWLAAKKMISVGFDQAKGLHTVLPTNQTIVEVAKEYLHDMGRDESDETDEH
jgi:hypothetical protein